MPDLFEKLIDENVWTMLGTPTEKLVIAWFATKHPDLPINVLFDGTFPLKNLAIAIGAYKRLAVQNAIASISDNQAFQKRYFHVSETCSTDAQRMPNGCSTDAQRMPKSKEKGKEEERKFSPQTPFIKKEGEKGKESVCADGTPPHTHDSSNDDSKGKKGKKQQPPAKEREAPVVLREPKAFNRFYQLYPKKSKMRQEKEKLKRLWHQCELDGWSGDVIVQALETAIRSERWTEKEGLYKPNAFKFLEEELMRDFLPIGYAPTPLVDASEENAEAEAHPGMIYKLGVWWTPEELQAYADSMIIPERLKGKVQI